VSARQTRFPSPLSVLRTPIKGVDHVGHFIFSPRPGLHTMMQPFQTQREPLTTIPGIGPFAAAAIISEAGADIAETFPSADHFASWIGLCPGNRESAGKRYSGKP
jgi:transposase